MAKKLPLGSEPKGAPDGAEDKMVRSSKTRDKRALMRKKRKRRDDIETEDKDAARRKMLADRYPGLYWPAREAPVREADDEPWLSVDNDAVWSK